MFRCVAPCARGGRPASARAVSGRYHRRRGRRDAPCRGRVGLQPRGARVGPGGGAARVRQGRQRRPRGESQGPGLSACPFGVTLLLSLSSSPFHVEKPCLAGTRLGRSTAMQPPPKAHVAATPNAVKTFLCCPRTVCFFSSFFQGVVSRRSRALPGPHRSLLGTHRNVAETGDVDRG